jgi:hypothetical protein
VSVSRLLVALIVAATAAFVVGVALERHDRAGEPARSSAAPQQEMPTEHAREGEGGAAAEGAEGARRHEAGESSETLLGVNPESTALVAAAVAFSLVLALAVWRASGTWWALGVVALAMAAFGALDVREAVHQASESRPGLTVLASAVAALHLGAALLSAGAAAGAARAHPR